MEKSKLIKLLNMIPDDVRCNIHGEYNGMGYECNVDVWCGKHLIRGWQRELDRGRAVDNVIHDFVANTWNSVDKYYDEDIECIVDPKEFVSTIEQARKANSIDWDKKIAEEVSSYLNNKPTEEQKKMANAINKVLSLDFKFNSNMTKDDYAKFIESNIREYSKWMEDNNPNNFN